MLARGSLSSFMTPAIWVILNIRCLLCHTASVSLNETNLTCGALSLQHGEEPSGFAQVTSVTLSTVEPC